MNHKYLVTGMFALVAIIAWNVFLIQRDDALYKVHYRQQTIQNQK